MSTHKPHIGQWFAVAMVAAAVAVPTAAAEPRSLDDLDPALAAAVRQAEAASLSPDDRPLARGTEPSLATAAQQAEAAAVSPDDRPFARPTEPTPIHVEVVRSTGFDWGDATLGVVFGLAIALGMGTIATTYRHYHHGTPSVA